MKGLVKAMELDPKRHSPEKFRSSRPSQKEPRKQAPLGLARTAAGSSLKLRVDVKSGHVKPDETSILPEILDDTSRGTGVGWG